MRGLLSLLPWAAWMLVVGGQAWGEVRYYQDSSGVTWKEETRTVQRPVHDVKMQEQQQTYYREQVKTDVQNYQYTAYTPSQRYEWVPRWHGWWRIFEGPHVAYHLEPRVVWNSTPYQVSVPVTRREFVPETRTVQVPTSELRMESKEEVVRTAVAGPAPALATNPWPPSGYAYASPPGSSPWAYGPAAPVYMPAQPVYPMYGGIARVDTEPPKWGVPDDGGWHAIR